MDQGIHNITSGHCHILKDWGREHQQHCVSFSCVGAEQKLVGLNQIAPPSQTYTPSSPHGNINYLLPNRQGYCLEIMIIVTQLTKLFPLLSCKSFVCFYYSLFFFPPHTMYFFQQHGIFTRQFPRNGGVETVVKVEL